MSIRVDFNTPIDGGSGRKDVMRVLASAGPIADDLNPAVIFSSAYSATLGERPSATISGLTPGTASAATGSLTLSRKYETFPFVLASYTQDDGAVLQPFLFTQVYSRPDQGTSTGWVSTVERVETFAVDVINLGSNAYRIDYELRNSGVGSALRNGVLRVFALGKGV